MRETPTQPADLSPDGMALPDGSGLGGDSTIIDLYPPVIAEISGHAGRYRALIPFGSTTADRIMGEAPIRPTRLRAGGVTVVGSGSRLTLRLSEPVEILVLSIAPARMLRLAAPPADLSAWQAPTTTDFHDAGVAALAHELRRSLLADDLRHPAYRQALADAIVVRLLCRFAGELDENGQGDTLPPGRLAKVLRHIDTNLHTSLRVGELAGMIGLTRSHFSRAFQRATGDPPQRYILKRRVCRARDLLAMADIPIAEVAVRAGFSSQAHLSTALRAEVGTTPARYRAAFRS